MSSIFGTSIFQEIYYGKTETLLEIENQIGVIRSQVMTSTYFTKFNQNDEVLKLNRLFEKQFGMDTFCLQLYPASWINAFTYPIGLFKKNGDIDKKVTADKSTYKFKKGNNLCVICVVTSGLMMKKDITNGEVLAVILHELGHNFADAIDPKVRDDNNAVKQAKILSAIVKTYGDMASKDELIEKKARQPLGAYTNNKFESDKEVNLRGISAMIQDFFGGIGELLSTLSLHIPSYIMTLIVSAIYPKNQFMDTTENVGKTNEMIADRFASMYGYGDELITGLAKLEKNPTKMKEAINKIPFISTLFAYTDIGLNIIYSQFDVHPTIVDRMQNQIDALKGELAKKDLDPKLAEIIKSDIKNLEETKEDLLNSIKKISDPASARQKLYKYFASKPKDEVTKEVAKRIEEEIDAIVK